MRSLCRPRPGILARTLPALLLAAGACGGAGDPATVSAADGGEMLVHLEGRTGATAAARAHVSYQKERVAGMVTEEFEVQVEKAPSGQAHVVTLDGREIGRMVTDLDGEAELELGAEGERALPADFVAPRPGSELRIGELLALRLEPLERLVHLEASVEDGKVSGKVSYKAERLAGEVTRQFKLKLSGLPKNTVQPLRIGAIAIGNLTVGSDGKAKLEYSEADQLPFPAGFPQPEAGTALHVGELARGEFLSRLAGPGRGE